MYFFFPKKEHGKMNTMYYLHRFNIFIADLARNLGVINFSFFFFFASYLKSVTWSAY